MVIAAHERTGGSLAREPPAVCTLNAVSYPPSMRDPVGRHRTYPVSRSDVDSALNAASVPNVTRIYFLLGGERWANGTGKVIEVCFRAVTRDQRDATELRLYAVPTGVKPMLDSHLSAALHTATQWLADLANAGNAFRSTDHRLNLDWDGTAIQAHELSGRLARYPAP